MNTRSPDPAPVSPAGHPRRRAPGGTRTHTAAILSRLPLPIGLQGPGRTLLGQPRRAGGPDEDLLQHRGGQPAGEGVLLADVVTAEQLDRIAAGDEAQRS